MAYHELGLSINQNDVMIHTFGAELFMEPSNGYSHSPIKVAHRWIPTSLDNLDTGRIVLVKVISVCRGQNK